MNATAAASDSAIVDSIVVCRRDQLREAAVVLSCLPHGEAVPLIVLEPPPCSQADYRTSFAAYRQLADARDQTHGTEAARAAFGATQPSASALDLGDVDAAAEELTPYRQWAKHQSFVARLLHRLAPARAIFLFAPSSEDVRYLDPLARHWLGEEQNPIVPEQAAHVYLLASEVVSAATSARTYATLAELSDLAWQILRQSPPDRARAREIPESQTAQFFTGLYDALQRDVALRPVRDAAVAADAFCDPVSGAPGEAVLIECTDDAERLLGVQYARRCDARLLVIAEPDGAPIEAARAAVERRNAPVPLPGGLSKEQIVAAVRASLLTDDASTELVALEKAVSAALPDAVFAAVGDLPLTALTTSTPYHFAVKNELSWAEKPIGHVAGDISLLLLAEMFAESLEPLVGFNLLFDPGYISTTETSDVLSDLREGSSHSLLLAGPAGATLALTLLASALPIDLLFLNTHGSDNGIKLVDMPVPLPAYKLVQRTTLANRPIVFNNSCLSWVGVGREFVRAGARAYIGTLWSVHDERAAEYAKSVIGRMVRSDEPVSSAMRDTGVSAVDARAYVLIGTARTRLHRGPTRDAGDASARLLRAASFLLNALDGLLVEAAGSLSNTYLSAIVDVILSDAEAILGSLDEAMPVPSEERIDDALMQMRIYAALLERDEREAIRAHSFFSRWVGAIAKMPDERARFAAEARLFLYASRVPARVGTLQEAIGALDRSVSLALKAGDPPVQQYLELCDAYIARGSYSAAREALVSAERCYTAASMAADPALFGRQARVALCYGAFPASLERAERGFAAAAAGDDLRARAIAKIDAANAYRGFEDKENALAAAQAAVAYARLAYDNELELRANEVLAIALMQNERPSEAEVLAKRSLALAKQWGWTIAIAAQAEVAGDIAMRMDDSVGAFTAWCGAAWLYVKVRRPVFEARLLEKTKRVAHALGAQGVVIQYLRLSLGVVDDFEPPLRAAVASQYVRELTSLVARLGIERLRDDLAYLRSEATGIAAARGPDASAELNDMVALASAITNDAGMKTQ